MKLNGEFEYDDRVRLKTKYTRYSIPASGITQHSTGIIIGKDPTASACYLVNFSQIDPEALSIRVSYYDLVYRRPDKIGTGLRKLICQLTTLEKTYRKLSNHERNRNRR